MNRDDINETFKALVGKPLTIARLAGSMRNFDFGEVSPNPNGGSGGEYALHLQCPWRIDGPQGTVTGSDDLWEHETLPLPPSGWTYESGESLQDRRLGELLGGYDAETRSWVNPGSGLVVLEVDASDLGDVTLKLAGGYTLRIFPARSCDESWRLFRPRSAELHVVFGEDPVGVRSRRPLAGPPRGAREAAREAGLGEEPSDPDEIA
jgi:hypothetical protein